MFAKFLRVVLRMFIGLLLAVILAIGLPRLIAEAYSAPRIYSQDNSPSVRVAIVFGAGLQRNGTPTPVLRDRIETAVALYQAGKVEKLLMSGDNRFENYNEPGAMREYALGLGVPDEDIVLDFAGRRTYDTCYRAKEIFGLKEAILVTQRFHLTRAVFICNNLGVKATGVVADGRRYRRSSLAFWQMRESAAIPVAFWEVWISRPLPVLGNPEPIFPDESVILPGFTRK